MSEIKTPPATDAYREGWDRTFSANVEKGDSGESSVHAAVSEGVRGAVGFCVAFCGDGGSWRTMRRAGRR